MFDKVTKKDIRRMEEELEHRILVIRKEALEMVKEARAHGDLSENFEYKAAKQYKNQNEGRIRYLQKMIKTAQIIDESSPIDVIGLNNKVKIYVPEDEAYEEYKIVTTVRANSVKGYISIDSPLGKALLGKRVGDHIFVPIQGGEGYEIEVVSFENTEDDGKDSLRKF